MNPFITLINSLWWISVFTNSIFVLSKNTTSDSRHIKTSSLLTCMENSQFTSSFFDVEFYPGNSSIVFNINAVTTISEKIVIKVKLIAYGLNVLSETFDLCSLGEKTVCPLSAGRIDISSSYKVDSSITSKIPNIAYTIPDLDAQVRVVAYSQNDTDFSTPLACVQAVLNNGRTVQTKYASWPIAAVSGLGLLTSGFVSVVGHSSTSAHIASNSISLFVYFQNLAITAMMGVARVPPIAAAWAQNFEWSMGIINVGFMQRIFNWYIQATGGTSVVVIANKDILSISVQKKRIKRTLVDGVKHLAKRISVSSNSEYNFESVFSDSDLYTTNERNTTDYSSKILVLNGIERVAYLAGIELSNFFLTGIVFFLFFVFIVIVSLLLFKALVEVLTRARIMAESSKFFEYRKNWANVMKGTLFRLAIIAFPQVSILSIWEFTQRDSPAVVVVAVAILIVIFGLLLYGVVKVILRGRESIRLYKTPAYLLYGDLEFLNRYGFLYVQFKADMYWWLMPLLCYSFFRSLFVAVLQNNGKPQAFIIFFIELAYFISICWIRPYMDKRTNAFNIVIHLVNFLNSLFFLFFSNVFNQPPIVSSILAIVLFIVNAVFALFLLIFTVVTCVLALVHRNPDARYQPMKDDRGSFIPKIQNINDNPKLDKELLDLGKTAMAVNTVEPEKQYADDTLMQHPNNSKRILFDDELDGSSSLDSNKGSHNKDTMDSQPLQPSSAVLGTNNFTGGYHQIPSAPSSGRLRKLESTVNNTSYQGYVGSNPYSNTQYSNSRSFM